MAFTRSSSKAPDMMRARCKVQHTKCNDALRFCAHLNGPKTQREPRIEHLGEPSLLRGYKWKCVGMVPPSHSGGVRSVVPHRQTHAPREKPRRIIRSVRLISKRPLYPVGGLEAAFIRSLMPKGVKH